jgi:hypothetical protein
LLELIARTAKESLASTAVISKAEKYNEKDAAETFLKDMRPIRSNKKGAFLALLFDEVERISFGTASSAHWNDDRDFLHFWQAIRYGFQSTISPFSFAIVGTNPSSVEKVKIFESDNPLFGNVEKRFIPMFAPAQVDEMVDDLGAIMGVHIDAECKAKLYADFGGHPFLTRYACSYIANSSKDRPLEVDRTSYSRGVSRFAIESYSYVESIVGLLQDEYPEEFEMLRYLGVGDISSFQYLADADPRLSEHLSGYGIVSKGAEAYFFRIGVVESYFANADRPINLMTQENRLAEISAKRNELEKKLRNFVARVLRISFSPSKRIDAVLCKVAQERRERLQDQSFDNLLAEGLSPLFFDELKTVICGNWACFENALELQKPEFEYHMSVVNRYRSDAHAKHVNDHDFEKWRVSVAELLGRVV